MTHVIWYADGADSPRTSPADVAALTGLVESHTVMLGWTPGRMAWVDELNVGASTTMAGYGLASAIAAGRITALSVRLSAVPSMLELSQPAVGVVTGIRRGDSLAFGASVGYGDVLARVAQRLIVEIDEDGDDLGAPLIEGNVVATTTRPPASHESAKKSRVADEVDLAIGARVASLLPDEPTLEFGPGGIGEGIARAINRPVHIVSGLVTESMAELYDRGLLLSPVIAAYAWGGEPIRRLARSGMLKLTSLTRTHDISWLSSIPRFVGCNTAIQVGLDGAVNVEQVGSRTISGLGGHADFCVAASRSVGGMSLIALRSTTPSGASTIVNAVEVVSTPRCDIDVIVTEHGIVDLRGVGIADRARRLIAIAAPEHRAKIEEQSQSGMTRIR